MIKRKEVKTKGSVKSITTSKRKKEKITQKQRNVAFFIDGENISYKKAEQAVEIVKARGMVCSGRVYGLQKDESTKGWSEKAKKLGIMDIRLSGSPEKDKVDKKMQKDIKNVASWAENIDIVCIISSDGGFSDTAKQLIKQGKWVVGLGEKKTPGKLRNSCSEFIDI